MECPKCQHENPLEARFCEDCGSLIERVCPQCHQAISPTAKFCMACGHDLSQPGPPSAPSAPTPLSETSPPAGERRQATVLFSDLSGYTAMNEKLDPEEVERIMSRIKAEAVAIVENHGGIVSQFVGDEVLALFGIPAAHEDDPRRAVRAALELHEIARNMSPEVEEKIERPLRMHTGIHSGLVVTSLRDDRDGRVGITGDTVNTGARLKALAKDDQILVSPETKHRIAPFFDLESLPEAELKGKAGAVTPYRVTGESAVKTPFEAAEARGFTPYAGRETELATLQALLQKAMSGEGRILTISGEAGLGKSRLAYEFRHGIDRDQVNVLEGRCQSYGTATPYLPFLNALRRGLNLEEADSTEALREKAIANVRKISPDLGRYLPHYLYLLSIPAPDYPLPEGLPGEALRRELEEALAAIFTENTAHKPMVLILEDWHWADEASDAALKRLAPLAAQYPLLVVILHRPEYISDFGGATYHTEITLPPLNAGNTAAIARSVWNVEHLPEGLTEVLHERTAGNPYFAEELCHTLAEEGVVTVTEGRVNLTGPVAQLHVPGTVEAVIRSRVDRLPNASREVLRLASVIGREFGRQLLEAVTEGKVELHGVLEELTAQELIRHVRMLPESAYMFKHILMQGVVYETILLHQRRVLHGIVARAIEKLYADRLLEFLGLLAHHYSRAQENEKAVEYNVIAGKRAKDSFANQEAISFYKAALMHVEQILYGKNEKADTWRDSAMQTQESMGDLLDITGKHEEARAAYQKALPLVPENDRISRSRMHRKSGNSWVIERRYEEAVLSYATAETSLGQESSEPDPEWWQEWIAIQLDRILMHYWLAQTEEMGELLEKTRRVIDQYGTLDQRALFFQRLSWMAFRRYNYRISEETLAHAQAAVTASVESANLSLLGYNRFSVGFCHLWRGELDEATEHLQGALSLSERIGDVTLQARCLTYLTIAYRKRRQVEETRNYISQSLDVAMEGNMIEYIGTAKANLAWVAWREGNVAKAEELGRAALDLWGQLPIVYSFQWTALWPLIGVSLDQGKITESIDFGRSLLEPFQQRLPDALSEVVGEAMKAWDRGHQKKSARHLEQSVQMAQEMGYL